MRVFIFSGLLLTALTTRAQILISGRLLDERQQPVPYARVTLAGSQPGTASNEVGEFELRVATLPQQLTVASIGYEPATRPVLQAGALPAPVVLRASAEQLPAAAEPANAAAEALVRRCYAQLLRHQADVQYGRGFYRQKTQQGTRYHEFFDAFYDVKITPRNLPSWVLGEGRYALTPGRFTLTNFSVYTRLLPVFALPSNPASTATPLGPHAAEQFQFVLRATQRTPGREVAVIDFAPRRTDESVVRGTLYIDVATAALWRIERDMPTNGLYVADTPELRIERYALHVTNDFASQPGDSLTRLASTRAVAKVQLVAQGVKQQSVTSSQFFLYEYGPPTPGEKYRDAKELEKDVATIHKRRYQPAYWRTNAVLQNSPAEERAIRDLEKAKTFGKLD